MSSFYRKPGVFEKMVQMIRFQVAGKGYSKYEAISYYLLL